MRFSSGIAVVVAALCCSMLAGQAQAQSVYGKHIRDGYGFGVGNSYGFRMGQQGGFTIPGGSIFGGGFIVSNPREDVPYFAKYPPVYYNGIIARPYGISPYAAPPGIMPVEMMQLPPAEPVIITNPHVIPPAGAAPAPATDSLPHSNQHHPEKPMIEERPVVDPNSAGQSGAWRSLPRGKSVVEFRRPGQRVVNPHRVQLSLQDASLTSSK